MSLVLYLNSLSGQGLELYKILFFFFPHTPYTLPPLVSPSPISLMVSADVKHHVYLHTLNFIIITVIDLWLNSSTCTTSANAAMQPQNSGRRHSMAQLQRPGLTIVRTEAYVPRLILIVFAPYLQKPICTSAAVNAVNNTR